MSFLKFPLMTLVSLNRYYTFDDAFVREVLGKKLSKGTKKDLDDISAKTSVTLKSCRRQVRASQHHNDCSSVHLYHTSAHFFRFSAL